MKKRIYFIHILISIMLCLATLLLYLCGFRITYDPSLTSDWDAISACASWFGAIMSVIAIFVAIRIPKIIAERQNNIALFDKKYGLYDTFVFLMLVIRKMFDGSADGIEMKKYLETLILLHRSVSTTREITSSNDNAVDSYTRLIFEVGKIKFLFDLKESDDILNMLGIFNEYISDLYRGKLVDENKLRDAFFEMDVVSIQNKMEAQLKL